MKPDDFVKGLDGVRIVAAIREAEDRSRGEIRVHVAEGPVDDARAAAQADFERLGMTATAERNGVLILVAPESQAFAVVHSRRTVAGETPRTLAASSMVSPPKKRSSIMRLCNGSISARRSSASSSATRLTSSSSKRVLISASENFFIPPPRLAA